MYKFIELSTAPTTPEPTPPPRQFDLVIMVDSSTVSMDTFNSMLEYARQITSRLSIDDEKFRVGVMSFGTEQEMTYHMNTYNTRDRAVNGINQVQYLQGETNTAAAFDYVRENMFTSNNGDRPWARNYILLLTGSEARYSTIL